MKEETSFCSKAVLWKVLSNVPTHAYSRNKELFIRKVAMVQINNTLQISVSRLSELPQVCEHGQSPVVPPGKEGKLSVYSAILCQQNIYI